MLLANGDSLFLLRVVDLIEIEFDYIVGWEREYVVVLFLKKKFKSIFYLNNESFGVIGWFCWLVCVLKLVEVAKIDFWCYWLI